MGSTEKKKTQFKGVLLLMITALVWGSSFVAQSKGMDSLDAFSFNGIRTILGSLVLLPIVLMRDKASARSMTEEQLAARKAVNKKTLRCGLILGVVLCAASNFQQFAFYDTSSGKIAFITSFYMFFVPLFGLILGKRVPIIMWICVFFGCVGMFFLCIDPANPASINKGDLMAFICSLFYAVHILLVEKLVPDVDGVKLSCVQFAVSGALSCVLMMIFEEPSFSAVWAAAIPILYSGVMSCGVGYTLQIVGQKYTEATIATLIMCLESVFGVLAGALLLNEILSGREILGCVIMFAAIVLSQLSDTITEKLRKSKTVHVK